LISSSANIGSQGNSGDITINSGRLTVTDGAQISTKIDSVGNAGDIKIRATDAIELRGEQLFLLGGTVSSRITTETNLDSSGQDGNLSIETQRLNVLNGAAISTSTASTGNAGNLTIKATNVNVSGKGFSPSSMSSGVGLVATGAGGALFIDTQRLNVDNGAEVSTVSRGAGNAGGCSVE
jgi:large exoprotein involved in heme utilization and adhesion